MDESSVANPPPTRPRGDLFWKWFGGAIVGITLAALGAAHLPDRVKLLGLFPLIWGAVCGWGLGWWRQETGAAPTRVIFIMATSLLLLGEAGMVLESWRMYRAELRAAFRKDPSSGFLNAPRPVANEESQTEEERALRQQFHAELDRVSRLRQAALGLPVFLQRRLRSIGILPRPWAELFWAGEIVLGTVCGAWMYRRHSRAVPHSLPHLAETPLPVNDRP